MGKNKTNDTQPDGGRNHAGTTGKRNPCGAGGGRVHGGASGGRSHCGASGGRVYGDVCYERAKRLSQAGFLDVESDGTGRRPTKEELDEKETKTLLQDRGKAHVSEQVKKEEPEGKMSLVGPRRRMHSWRSDLTKADLVK